MIANFLKNNKGWFMSDEMNVGAGVLIGLLVATAILVGLEFAGYPLKDLIMSLF